jgi:hypothetical protein
MSGPHYICPRCGYLMAGPSLCTKCCWAGPPVAPVERLPVPKRASLGAILAAAPAPDQPTHVDRCGLCAAPLGTHHEKSCTRWGPVVPSECPGCIERALAEVLARRAEANREPKP